MMYSRCLGCTLLVGLLIIPACDTEAPSLVSPAYAAAASEAPFTPLVVRDRRLMAGADLESGDGWVTTTTSDRGARIAIQGVQRIAGEALDPGDLVQAEPPPPAERRVRVTSELSGVQTRVWDEAGVMWVLSVACPDQAADERCLAPAYTDGLVTQLVPLDQYLADE